MNDTRRATLAGLLILASIFAAVAIIIATTNTDSYFAQTRRYVAEFGPGDDVQGLDDLSAVRVLGVEVGSVESVEVEPTPAGQPRVRVVFSLPDNHVLYPGASVSVQSQITGGARLNIDSFGDAGRTPLPDGTPIAGTTHTLEQVMAKVTEGIDSFTLTSTAVRDTVEEVRGHVRPAMERYNAVMTTAQSALANARDILGDSKSDIRDTLANLNSITGTTSRKLPEAIEDAQSFMAKAKESLAKLDPILDDGKAISAQTREIIADNRVKIDQTLTNVRRASVELKGTMAEVRRAPWRVLNEPDAKDQRNLELYEAARHFADGAHDLQAAALSIELAAANPQTDPEKLNTLRAELASEIETFVEARQRLYERFEQ